MILATHPRAVPRRAGRLVVVAGLLLLAPSFAAAVDLTGSVLHPSRPEAAVDVEVMLVGVDAQENTLHRETRTDERGGFRFDDLPTPAAYLVSARYAGIRFPGGTAVFRPGEEPKADPIEIRIFERTASRDALSLGTARWVIEHEAGEFRVLQTIGIRNPGDQVAIVEPSAPPLLRFALAPEHGEVSTPFGALGEGVAVEAGVVEIRGPVLPGEQELRFTYAIEAPHAVLDTRIAVLDPLEALEIYVEDFGIDVDPGALHPARAVRHDGRVYQAWMGFELGADRSLPLRIRPLPPPARTPPWIAAATIAALAGLGLWLVGHPLIEARRSLPSSDEPSEIDRVREDLQRALLDLEHDFETGKLSAEDRDRLREDLRNDAVLALARHRARGDAAQAPARSCCGRSYAASDRFCASCGKPL